MGKFKDIKQSVFIWGVVKLSGYKKRAKLRREIKIWD